MRLMLLLAAGIAVAVYAIVTLAPILAPFIIGIVLAYLLDPIAEFLVRKNIPRTLAALLPVGLFFLIFFGAVGFTIPAVADDIARFAEKIPEYIGQIENRLIPYLEANLGAFADKQNLLKNIYSSGDEITSTAMNVFKKVASSTVRVVDILSLLLITPIVVFYMVRDWPNMRHSIYKLVPDAYVPGTKRLMARMDERLSGFIRGQLLVVAALSTYYAIGLQLVGLQMGVVIGLVAGALSIIPFVGSIIGFVIAIIVAMLQFSFGDWVPFAMVVGVFLSGQVLEGYVFTPKFVGDKVGLHPVWVIFAVLAGGQLGGFVGVLVAMPLASVMTVLVPESLALWKGAVEDARQDEHHKKTSRKKPAVITDSSET